MTNDQARGIIGAKSGKERSLMEIRLIGGTRLSKIEAKRKEKSAKQDLIASPKSSSCATLEGFTSINSRDA